MPSVRARESRRVRVEKPVPVHSASQGDKDDLLDVLDGEELPDAGEPFELGSAGIAEPDLGSGDQVPDRARNEDLTRPGLSSDTRADVHGNAAELVTDELALPGMEAGPKLEPEFPH